MITHLGKVLHRLGIKTEDESPGRDPPSRPQATNGSGPEARRDPAAQAGQSRWNLVAIRRWRNTLFDSGQGPESTKILSKARTAARAIFLRPVAAHEKRPPKGGLFFFSLAQRAIIYYVLIETWVEHRVSRRISRSAERASGQRCPRARALAEQVGHSLAGKRPAGAFSHSARLRKAGETFGVGCGGKIRTGR